MKRFLATTFVVAAVLALLFVWLPPELKAGLRYATPASSPPQLPEAARPEPTIPASEVQRRGLDKCLDGSALSVTGRDSNQTNYRCESGAIGAYTN
jgi:hypothetical protein